MNWCEVKGNWDQFKLVLKAHWPELSDDDLTAIAGDRHRLRDVLCDRLGCDLLDAENRISAFEKDVRYPGAVK